MLRRLSCLVAGLVMFSFSTAWADTAATTVPWGWAVVANEGNSLDYSDPAFVGESIYTVDLTQTTPIVHGPYLSGQLGAIDPVTHEPHYGGGVFDVEQIPGTKDVLISNFGDSMLFRVSLANPTSPVVVGSVNIGFFAEDIVITKDGKLAIVTDGGFSSKAAFIDLPTMTLKSTFPLYEGVPFDPATPPSPLPDQYYANAVDLTPDGQTLIMADYWNGTVVYGKINAARDGLESVHAIHLCPNWDPVAETCGQYDYVSQPVNLRISPDGQTVIVNDAGWGMVDVLRVTGPGQVVAGAPFQLWGLPDTYEDYLKYEYMSDPNKGHDRAAASQSTAFSPDGKRAYILQNSTAAYVQDPDTKVWSYDAAHPINNKLSWVSIDGPGQASVGGVWEADLFDDSGSQLFGVDTLAISKDGRYAYASNPTLSGAAADITKVDLSTFATTKISFTDNLPVGVSILAPGFNWDMFLPGIISPHQHAR